MNGDFDPPDEGPVAEAEEDGRLLRVVAEIQCMGGVRDLETGDMIEPCGTVIRQEVQIAEGEVEGVIVCPNCSARAGIPIQIPVAVLVGQEVADNLDEAEGEGDIVGALDGTDGEEQPFTGADELDAHGPMRLVTEDGEKIG